MSRLDRKRRDRLEQAHQDWTAKFVQAQREAGVRVDVDGCAKRAEAHVSRVEQDLERQR